MPFGMNGGVEGVCFLILHAPEVCPAGWIQLFLEYPHMHMRAARDTILSSQIPSCNLVFLFSLLVYTACSS